MTSITLARPSLGRSLVGTVMLALGISLLLTLSAKISVPFWPVPTTMQPFVVLAVAALAGPRLALAGLAAYVIEGAFGLPVFTGTPARGIGLAYMAGPTLGYIVGWFPATLLVGTAARKLAGRPALLFATMLAGVAVIYALGALWLGQFTGWSHVVEMGVLPFVLGDTVKAALATALVMATARLRRA